MTEDYLTGLNNPQKDAVLADKGPILILAGAGSGKTKVLTTRLIHLIKNNKCLASQVLCVTFTNKAANEMKERVMRLLVEKKDNLPWLGTFHSLSNKILRRHPEAAGLKPNFTILDTLDQLKIIKNVLEAEKIDIKKFPPKLIASLIDKWKNKALTPEDVLKKNEDSNYDITKKIYSIYQERLKTLNCVDFGDLILHCITIFKKIPEILETYQNSFKYILVDEYQDTNEIQNIWLNYFAKKYQNICCVGDDDQSIYSWRGAEIKNILNFEKIYKNTKTIRLEQNYRSTQNILEAASSVISNNKNRLGKKLWSDNKSGELIYVNCYKNGFEEAVSISDEIEKNILKKINLNNISILIRAAYQTRELEDRFVKINIPYRIIGGYKFYDRAEIKDTISFLRLINFHGDDLAFERIVNVPKKGIGDSSLKELRNIALEDKISLFEACEIYIEKNKSSSKIINSLTIFLKNIINWKKLSKQLDHIGLTKRVLDESGYTQMLMNEKTPEADSKLENLKELLVSMRNFSNLNEFLENITLQTSIDEDWKGEKINIMTMHSAKGLEFDVVFLPGWEEGLFPHQKSIDESGNAGIEEERRLAYVAITRAKKRLFISFANNRKIFGTSNDVDWFPSLPSRFIDELPQEVIKINNNTNYKSDDFEFNQETTENFNFRSPGWERLISSKKNMLVKKKITYNNTKFLVGESVNHEEYGEGKIIHIDSNKLIVNFKKFGEKKIIDKFLNKNNDN